uniref:Plant heme peroxidase family profile domain-containing protein n=1 Tax=Pseudictyota dubia TaxID=2749911 RepID=A0A7R9WDK6_9STRA|mmetsp:Transcript_43881/g.81598  ORF Transcript_43881/g.81598 Transcript_43881/m.81598 type:complete len:533 (+) Transcript_43881:155-1753(+)|eukprot:CAMPEP_0197436516 /NCGR_PEP_ID=MMETSP1175-20131217/3952_1 /TAXON_ID=1003142 /ORGANISM="Triceratium dubium, Strain CCMP147" /LENGTH=532 /DNA_ID=CAMNT_0042965821 /DNA_START=108 /DNA_END=1706 /DNA_ORIENTATION=+
MKFTVAALIAVTSFHAASARLHSDFERTLQDGAHGGGGGCECVSDYDCKPNCVVDPYTGVGTCGGSGEPPKPTDPREPTAAPPTPSPISSPPCPCDAPKIVPTKCELDILIAMLDLVIGSDPKRAGQLLRASFHDAGTFDQGSSVGGANGCLMNHPPMLLQAENAFLDLPMAHLEAVRDNWEAHPLTCIDISSADIIQFAGFFVTVRQRGPSHGVLDAAKIAQLYTFEWGRTDETSCDITWTHNLPGFSLPTSGGPIPGRCGGAGEEIRTKMMNKNGFTAEEATALIGAHTIGHLRNTFGPGFNDPWVQSGRDNATPNGPKFGNAFHDFLKNTIVENTAPDFAANVAPFTMIFGDWFRDAPNQLNHLDTDVTLAFPPVGTHPDYSVFTSNFAASEALFLDRFDKAYEKMSKLGVTDPLSPPHPCDPPCDGEEEGGGGDEEPPVLTDARVVVRLVKDLGNATAYGEAVLDDKQANLAAKREALITEVDRSKLEPPFPKTGDDSDVTQTSSTRSSNVETNIKTAETSMFKRSVP